MSTFTRSPVWTVPYRIPADPRIRAAVQIAVALAALSLFVSLAAWRRSASSVRARQKPAPFNLGPADDRSTVPAGRIVLDAPEIIATSPIRVERPQTT